jgi:hypothetical protein
MRKKTSTRERQIAAPAQEEIPMPDIVDDAQGAANPIPNDIIRDSLKMLYTAFRRAVAKYPPLYHQQLIPPYFATEKESKRGDLADCASDVDQDWDSTKEWGEFAAANSPSSDNGWQEWHGPVEGECYEWFGRFFGHRDGLDEFRFLANTFYLVLRKLDPKLLEGGGYERLLDMMHQAAASWPTTFLRSTDAEWGLDAQEVDALDSDTTTIADLKTIWNKANVGPNGIPFFVHPTAMKIEGNLFLAAAQFVKMIGRDDLTLFFSDVHLFEPDYPIVDTTMSHTDQHNPLPPQTTVAETHDPGKLVVSQDDFCAHNKGKVCPLSRRPFSVLEVLNSRSGKPVSLETLRQKAWPDDPLVDDETIQRQVSVLRKKLEKHGLVDVSIDGKIRPGWYLLTLK